MTPLRTAVAAFLRACGYEVVAATISRECCYHEQWQKHMQSIEAEIETLRQALDAAREQPDRLAAIEAALQEADDAVPGRRPFRLAVVTNGCDVIAIEPDMLGQLRRYIAAHRKPTLAEHIAYVRATVAGLWSDESCQHLEAVIAAAEKK